MSLNWRQLWRAALRVATGLAHRFLNRYLRVKVQGFNSTQALIGTSHFVGHVNIVQTNFYSATLAQLIVCPWRVGKK